MGHPESRSWLIALLCLFGAVVASAQDRPAPTKQALCVLYVGSSASPDAFKKGTISQLLADPRRFPDFKQFLEKNFTSVKTCEGNDFTAEMARDVDVTIMDARVPAGRIPADFTRPMVVMGGTGFFSIEDSGTKIDWL